MKRAVPAKSFDAYLATVPADKRPALERLRRIIRAAVPRAEETVSYGLAAFRLDGRVLVLLGATPSHCAFYPGSGTAVGALGPALRGFSTSKGTIRFQPDRQLPAALVRRIVRYRLAEQAGQAGRRTRSHAESRRRSG
jgi:uncharacterized protein YdhG (YjbR/CyaY superfamily)